MDIPIGNSHSAHSRNPHILFPVHVTAVLVQNPVHDIMKNTARKKMRHADDINEPRARSINRNNKRTSLSLAQSIIECTFAGVWEDTLGVETRRWCLSRR